jgi:perosamine synthetase
MGLSMQEVSIPLFRPVISEQAIAAVADVLRSGWLGTGPQTGAFESALAEYLGAPFCVGLNSGTAALHLSLQLLHLPAGAEVITTPITFVATNHAILQANCRPVFADIQLNTGNLDLAAVKGRISENTGAIMLVHYGGYPCDLDEFYALGRERGIPIVEDCAHACGAAYKGRRIGSHGDLHAFSFQAVKNLSTGDGGAIALRSPEYRRRLQRLRWLGIDSETHQRQKNGDYDWRYTVVETGYKAAMNDVQAAIGLAQLRLLDAENVRRASIAAQYRAGLAGIAGLEPLQYTDDRTSSYHLFCILVEQRDALAAKLRSAGISTGVHYQRNDMFPMYEQYNLPNAERFWRSALSLPMHLMLTDDHVGYICGAIRKGW